MTKRVFIHRGVSREEYRICENCIHGARLDEGPEILMTCENEESDHFCHVFFLIHPACDVFKWRDEVSEKSWKEAYGDREGA